jgi:hypothetical protein
VRAACARRARPALRAPAGMRCGRVASRGGPGLGSPKELATAACAKPYPLRQRAALFHSAARRHARSVVFPVQTFGNRQTQRAVRVWARHVTPPPELATLAVVDAPAGRGTVPWRSWTAGKWEAAAQTLAMPLDAACCVRMRSLTGRGRSNWHIVWGRGGPLAGGAAVPFVYVFVPSELDRFVPLAELRALAQTGGGGADSETEEDEAEDGSAARPRITFIWAEARAQLQALLRQHTGLAEAAAAVLGLQESLSPAAAVIVHPCMAPLAGTAALDEAAEDEAGAPSSAPAALSPAEHRNARVEAARVRAAAAAAAAAAGGVPAAPPAFGFGEEDDDEGELDEEAARAAEEQAVASAERAARAAADAEAAALATEEAALHARARAGELWDPAASAWGGLSAAELLEQKGVAFGFLSLLERVRLIKGRAAASGFPLDNALCASWGRAAWDRAADEMGIVFFDAGWFAPLRRLPAGWHAAWCPDRGGWALYVAAPSAAGARFFSVAALHALTATTPPPGLPTWRDALDALRDAAAHAPGLANALTAELAGLDAAALRQRADAPAPPPKPAAAPAPRAPPPAAAAAAALEAAAAAASGADAVEGERGTLPGMSPVELYLQLGLGFAFMKLGSADAKRIVRAAAAAAKLPLSANAGWDKSEWAAASEQLQLTWLPEGTHSCTLPAMGRGVRAAWGAGRVYLYAPAPVDRFMPTPIIKAGFCNAALRPPTAPRGEDFPAWARTVDALSEAAASNPHLRAALLADAVFPKELLPPEDDAAPLADAFGRPGAAAGDAGWADEEDEAPDGMLLADFADDDSIFAPAAPAPDRARVNFAPYGMKARAPHARRHSARAPTC